MPFVNQSQQSFRARALEQERIRQEDPGNLLEQSIIGGFESRDAEKEKRRRALLEEERLRSPIIAEGIKSGELSLKGPLDPQKEPGEGEFGFRGLLVGKGPGRKQTDLTFEQQKELARIKASGQKDTGNLFQQEQAKQFGKAAVEFKTKGRAQLQQNVQKTQKAIEILKSGENVTGPIRGTLPGQKIINPRGAIAKQSIDSAILDTLRPTLGAQFTAVEGQQIKDLAFDPALDEKENLRRVEQLQNFIKKKVEFSDALFKYIEQFGC